MYRLGKLVNITLQKEVLLWNLIGICVTAYEVLIPCPEHWKFLTPTLPVVVNISLAKPPISIKFDKSLENHTLVVNITESKPPVVVNIRDTSKPMIVNIKDERDGKAKGQVVTINENSLQNQKIESTSESKSKADSFDLFDFYSLRIYFLTYITLLYPVCVQNKELLATPWMVMAGVRVLTPRLVFRAYMWVLVFSYWIWIMDKQLQSHRGVQPNKIKSEPWQEDRKDSLCDLELLENRRKAKGIRPEIARLSASEILGKSLEESKSYSIDLLESVAGCDLLPRAQSPNQCRKTLTHEDEEEIIEDETDEPAADGIKHAVVEMQMTPQRTVRVADCLLRQMTHLLFKLVDHLGKEIEIVDSDEKPKEVDIFRHYISLSPEASLLSTNAGALMQCPKYPKPSYLVDYPSIFAKRSGSFQNSSDVTLEDHLLFHNGCTEEYIFKNTLLSRRSSFSESETSRKS